MPTPTYELISSGIVTGSSTQTIQFTAIPQTYTHLHCRLFVHSTRSVGNEGGINVRFNDTAFTGTNYISNALYNAASTITAGGTTTLSYMDFYGINQDTQNVNQFSTNEFWIAHYTGTTNKTSIHSGANTTQSVGTGILSNSASYTNTSFTSAITSIYIRTAGGAANFAVNTRYYLYGVK